MNTMKRIVILLSVLCLTVGSHAQSDGTAVRDSILTSGVPNSFSIDLGVTVGATLYANGNDHSPYYSKHGFSVQIPLMAHWNVSPRWCLSSGLRYDFNWDPLYYAVEPVYSSDDIGRAVEEGLQFNQTPTTATQKSYAFHSYIGIPLEVKWHPFPKYRNYFGIALDCYAAFAVKQFFDIDNIIPRSDGFSSDGYHSDFNAMNPWKVEVGLSLTTGKLGLVHGLRLFTNLLPTYTDPTTGEKIYSTGMTIFL